MNLMLYVIELFNHHFISPKIPRNPYIFVYMYIDNSTYIPNLTNGSIFVMMPIKMSVLRSLDLVFYGENIPMYGY